MSMIRVFKWMTSRSKLQLFQIIVNSVLGAERRRHTTKKIIFLSKSKTRRRQKRQNNPLPKPKILLLVLAWLLCFFGNDALVISADLAKFIEDKKSTLKLEWTMLTAAIVILSLLSSINISIVLPMQSKAAEKANNEVLFSNILRKKQVDSKILGYYTLGISMPLTKIVLRICYQSGKIDLVEHRNLCQPIASQ